MVVVIIKAGLPDCQDPRMPCQFLNQGVMTTFGLYRIVRMNADTGVNPITALRDGDAAAHLIRTGAVPDRENLPNTGIPSPLNRGITIFIEPRVIEVRVRINQHESLQARAVLDFFVESRKYRLVLR